MVDPFGDCTAKQIVELLKKCPRLEELYLNTSLAGIEELFAAPELGKSACCNTTSASLHLSQQGRAHLPSVEAGEEHRLNNLTTLRLHPGRDATVELKELHGPAAFAEPAEADPLTGSHDELRRRRGPQHRRVGHPQAG